MNAELDETLCRKYPTLFRYRHEISEMSLMNEGFACGDGWYVLLDVISELLTKHNPDTFAIQIKEKLGSLNFYDSDTSDYSVGVEVTANTVSKYVCDICGAPGVLNRNESDWLATRCDEHKPENSATDNCDLDLSDVAHLKMGKAWSRLAAILQELADWFTEQNGMPAAHFFINVDKKGQLNIQYSRGTEITRGLVDLIVGYANRIDQDSGRPKDI